MRHSANRLSAGLGLWANRTGEQLITAVNYSDALLRDMWNDPHAVGSGPWSRLNEGAAAARDESFRWIGYQLYQFGEDPFGTVGLGPGGFADRVRKAPVKTLWNEGAKPVFYGMGRQIAADWEVFQQDPWFHLGYESGPFLLTAGAGAAYRSGQAILSKGQVVLANAGRKMRGILPGLKRGANVADDFLDDAVRGGNAWQQRHQHITSRLREHMGHAVKQAKLTPRQAADVLKNGSGSRYWGERIDKVFKELVQNDPLLRGDVAVSLRKLPKGSVAPDIIDLRAKNWWDLTSTGKEFSKKRRKYNAQYGQGTPILYAEPQ